MRFSPLLFLTMAAPWLLSTQVGPNHPAATGFAEWTAPPVATSGDVTRSDPGCSAILIAQPGGGITWGACPSQSCVEEETCYEETDGDQWNCNCSGTGEWACYAQVTITNGFVTEWFCDDWTCANTCSKTLAPVPPHGGSPIPFFACDCNT